MKEILKNKILYLDGAMGTEIQKYKLDYDGNNEWLSITHPDIIQDIHKKYLDAGSNIISTNTFGATQIGQSDYEKQDYIQQMNYASAQLARKAVDAFGSGFVAGSIGPTNKTASMSPRVNEPDYRAITFDELVENYTEQMTWLITGGVDLFLIETIFDTLNAKAALFAANKFDLPIIISATITDKSGRTLSGQTIEAFWNSVRHSRPLAVGINCALGAKDMKPYVERLSEIADCYISIYPNAGLPNPLSATGYDETPEHTAQLLSGFSGLVNIIGGCCGTTPAHIKEIVTQTNFGPRKVPQVKCTTKISGLEPLTIDNFMVIGERTNVAGSFKFKKLIKDRDFEAAVKIAQQQVDAGANIIDINFDDGLLDSEECMVKYLNLLAAEPSICKVPFMIDSSDWDVLEAGLKCVQGKCIVNSISLKDGVDAFLEKAIKIRSYGAAVVVMAFDEDGQAATYGDKIRICERSYKLLTEAGFPAEDIIFDCNVLTIGTGIEEHGSYAKDFIKAVKAVKRYCPGALTTGGISNVSFAFRGNNYVRNAMHSAFLFHAQKAGLDMAIVNAGVLPIYDDIDRDLLKIIEDLIFNLDHEATDKLIEQTGQSPTQSINIANVWREADASARISHALVHGISDYIIEDVKDLKGLSPLEIIEGPLMDGMSIVGDLFGEGKMFLPQVVKSARVMKKAVGYLEPLMDKLSTKGPGTIVLATVKGDVHDIGKNIVSIVLACNGYNIIDLGVMVSFDVIMEAAKDNDADLIGMSGLITPSLDEMVKNVKKMNAMGIEIPILIGGATTSKTHTAVKIAPHYNGTIVQVGDASKAVGVCNDLKKPGYRTIVKEKQMKLKHRFETRDKNIEPIEIARDKQKSFDAEFDVPFMGEQEYKIYTKDLVEYIDWTPFFSAWGLKGQYPQVLSKYKGEAQKVFDDAQNLLEEIIQKGKFKPFAKAGIWEAEQDNDDVIVEEEKLYFLRSQDGKSNCFSDWAGNTIGAFVVSIHGVEEFANEVEDDYKKILIRLLGDRFAEAYTELINKHTKGIIRPAPGYSGCPDHSEKKTLFKLLHPDFAKLTESCMVSPPSSVCGYYFFNPHSKYFSMGDLGDDQLDDYSARKGQDRVETYKWIGE